MLQLPVVVRKQQAHSWSASQSAGDAGLHPLHFLELSSENFVVQRAYSSTTSLRVYEKQRQADQLMASSDSIGDKMAILAFRSLDAASIDNFPPISDPG